MNGLGALIGLAFGTGLHVFITDPHPWRARRFTRRVLAHVEPRSGASAWSTRTLSERRMRSIAERQRLAGLEPDPAAHLVGMVTAAAAGLAVGATIVTAMLIGGAVRNPAASLLLLAVAATSGALIADRRLGARARHRCSAAALELPAVAESLALAVGAGASLPHAIDVIGRRDDGILLRELRTVVRDIGQGTPIDRALAAVHDRLPVASVLRFTDALRIALERGTPIVDVLHAQASDARHESRRLLMERAGKREVGMLVPVVFLVLPAVVVIALYPGFRELSSLTW